MPRPIRMFEPLTFAILGLMTFSNVDVEAGNTTCAGNLTDWCVPLSEVVPLMSHFRQVHQRSW